MPNLFVGSQKKPTEYAYTAMFGLTQSSPDEPLVIKARGHAISNACSVAGIISKKWGAAEYQSISLDTEMVPSRVEQDRMDRVTSITIVMVKKPVTSPTNLRTPPEVVAAAA